MHEGLGVPTSDNLVRGFVFDPFHDISLACASILDVLEHLLHNCGTKVHLLMEDSGLCEVHVPMK